MDIKYYTLTNKSGASVTLSNLGAGIISVNVPDGKGELADVVIGYEQPQSYLNDGPCAGKVPGRYANRIGGGSFELNGHRYVLPINNGPNHLHGGPEGFQNRIWEAREGDGYVEFMYFSQDGEMGYPGNLKVTARYEWTEDNDLILTFVAQSDEDTVINLTNHAYFNLDGHQSPSVLDHMLKLNASEYLPTDETLVPFGESQSVAGTPMDFVGAKRIGRDIKADFSALRIAKGYDACYLIDGYIPGQLSLAAELSASISDRVLKVYTTQPGIQVYTGNWLDGSPKGKGGVEYHDYCAVALECQHYPDSPNKSDYPSTVLKAGQTYTEAIIYSFRTKE